MRIKEKHISKILWSLFISIMLIIGTVISCNATNVIPIRGVLRVVYGGDTLDIMFSADSAYFTGNLEFYKMDGGLIVDSIRLANSSVWYSSLIAPSGNVDLSLAPSGAILYELNDTIGYSSGLGVLDDRIFSEGITSESSTGNIIETSADSNKIVNTAASGVNLIEAMNTSGHNILNAKYKNSLATNDTTRLYIDDESVHVVKELEIRDTTIIELINTHAGDVMQDEDSLYLYPRDTELDLIGRGLNAVDLQTFQALDTNRASGDYSTISGGATNTASGYGSSVHGGVSNSACGTYSSVAGGYGLISHDYGETVVGLFNTMSTGSKTSSLSANNIFTIGNGTNAAARSNAIEVKKSGDTYINEDLYVRDTTIIDLIEAHAGAGSVNLSYAPNGALLHERNDTISYNSKYVMYGSGNTQYLYMGNDNHASSGESALAIYNSTSGSGISVTNDTVNGIGINITNTNGIGLHLGASSGTALYITAGGGKSMVIEQLSGSITDGAPTDAEIDAITGLTPSTAGAGYQITIKDTGGTGLLYKIESDGTYWYYVVMTKAL